MKKHWREMVVIKREHLEHPYNVYGVILGESERLMLVQTVRDFRLDGLMVIAKSDITEIIRNRTERTQTAMLKKMGQWDKIPFDVRYDLSSWRAFFRDAAKRHTNAAVSCERGSDGEEYIGRLIKAKKRRLILREFSGTGRVYEGKTKLRYADITTCELNTRYVGAYERHFPHLRKQVA